ncbi:MAG: DNA repair protein RecN [Prolixibacteraceae bacterium]|nr:DNA repair protein RecN [Prolixibacteraceae bacterium]
MLTRLTIKNYALIDELEVVFDKGFNIVTGETGAGKSIILGALSLIIGNRADLTNIRDSSLKCVVEGVFNVEPYGLKPFFEKNDLDYDPMSIFRREITVSGKSRAFINDTPVSVKLMNTLGAKLIDIHSQHQNLELSTKRFQLELVDLVAGNQEILASFKNEFSEFLKKQKSLKELKDKAEKEKSDLDYFEFQFQQLDDAKLSENEQVELEEELEKLSHSEEIKTVFNRVSELLENDNISILNLLKETNNELKKVSNYFKEATELQARIESSLIELKDIAEEINAQSENIEYDPARLEYLNQRLDLIYSLQQKHHAGSVAELIQLKSQFEERISGIVDYDIQISRMEKELKEAVIVLKNKSKDISKRRIAVFPEIENKVVEVLTQLGMPKSRFAISHEVLKEFNSEGIDSIGFLFSANKDVEPDEISKIASGGETSRLMLAIKSLVASKKSMPTIIFDEIDSGVSGEIALKMGTILKEFSRSTQIINITHLPQIAGKGEHHYKVFKFENQKGTFTSVKKLGPAERIEELAKMVGGDNPTANAIQTAKELLN